MALLPDICVVLNPAKGGIACLDLEQTISFMDGHYLTTIFKKVKEVLEKMSMARSAPQVVVAPYQH